MEKFKLTIDIGNDAMRDLEDVADALRLVADKLDSHVGTEGYIVDANGNTAGSWEAV